MVTGAETYVRVHVGYVTTKPIQLSGRFSTIIKPVTLLLVMQSNSSMIYLIIIIIVNTRQRVKKMAGEK
jgi:hypothetical protein